MSLQSLTTWQEAYTALTSDLQNCTSSYSYCSGRKFQIPSTTEFCSLHSLEDRVLATLHSGKEALDEALSAVLAAIKDQQPDVQSCQRIYEDLTQINQCYSIIFQNEFLSLRDKIVALDENSDRRFYASEPSLLLRIALWICRFFSNLFKPSHESFRATLEGAQLAEAGHSEETGKFSPTSPSKQLEKHRALFTSYIHQQSLQHPEIMELKDIFNQLIPPTRPEYTLFGIPFTSDDVSYLHRNRDGFFLELKAADGHFKVDQLFAEDLEEDDDTAFASAFTNKALVAVLGLPENYTQEELTREYRRLTSTYSIENTEYYPPASIRLKFCLVLERIFWELSTQGKVDG